MANFNTLQAKEMIGSLSDNLQKIYYENNAQIIEFADFPEVAESSSVIIEGTPVFTNAKEQFNGFIMVPIHGGGMAMIPIIEQYEVYKIEEDEQQKVFVAHIKGKEKLPPKKVKLGGVIKSMSTDKKNGNNSGRFLEIQYYSERFNERF